MLKNLIQFEWKFYNKNWMFYLLFLAFFGLGFLASAGANFPTPNIYRNSPYALTFTISILSLATIFSTTLLAAQSLLRDKEAKFDSILYATPLKKADLLASRFLMLFMVVSISFATTIAGLMLGHQMPWLDPHTLGPFRAWHYLQPFIVFVLPNTLLCVALLCALAWTTQNKLMMYIGGLLIYVLYVLGSIFSNSPIMASALPSSPESIILASRLDPFGLASLFEQTQHWSAWKRNTEPVQLQGNFLINRILWTSISVAIIALAYWRFKFTVHDRNIRKQKATKKNNHAPAMVYKPIQPEPNSNKHHWQTLISFVRLDVTSVVKGIPLILILILWSFLLGLELYDAIDAGIRIPAYYASTGLIVNTILGVMPFFTLLVLLFYSNEILWRSPSARMQELENSAPLHQSMVFCAKLASLSVITVSLITYSIFIGIAYQFIFRYPFVEWGLYLSLFYVLGVPLVLCTVVMLSIQVIVNNKYVGLTLAVMVILATTTMLGGMLGIRHPLFRFAAPIADIYGDMNGFDSYLQAFHWRMLYGMSGVVLIGTVAGLLWQQRNSIRHSIKHFSWRTAYAKVLLLSATLTIFFGGYIFFQTNMANAYVTDDEALDWQQQYEEKYRRYQPLALPMITHVETMVELYPEENRYDVQGSYILKNTGTQSIDTILVYLSGESKLINLDIADATLMTKDERFGHYWYALSEPLQPGDSTSMTFRFTSSWSPFAGHTAFNSIVNNGSFMRISRYYPTFGYQQGNEIDNREERSKRDMPEPTQLKKIEAPEHTANNFIQLDAVVSTSRDQVAIGVGDLDSTWTANDRNYFRYKTTSPIPFRFAFSSARYAVKKDRHRDLDIEVYYHPAHGENVDQLIQNAKSTLSYCEDNFGPYPFTVIRFAEISKFAEGFAATAYPATIFMSESMTFHADLRKGDDQDVVNELAGHELSHQWWGTQQIAPDDREGQNILSETLAMYTELMIYQQAHGFDRTLATVAMHRDMFLSARSFSVEPPLYKAHPEHVHLNYNKGLVAMHQLRQLIGEDSLNAALASFLQHHAYPHDAPTSIDLLHEILHVSPVSSRAAVEEIFKHIVTHNARIDKATVKKSGSLYEVSFEGSIKKYKEDGHGRQVEVTPDATVEVAFYTTSGHNKTIVCPVTDNKIKSILMMEHKPEKIVIDPNLRLIDISGGDNEKNLGGL
ncbi:MAG: M1 family aminopeptidase [Bacteroidota bacterium]